MKTFECGCMFETKNDQIIYNPDITKLPLNCKATWDLICEGNTKGVFQLESQLGRSLAKQAAPSNMEELSDLIAIMRPGCLEAIVDGKSLTQHYIDRKHGRDPVEYFHPALQSMLSSTYGILVYQEQALLIARGIAGFDLQEADILRKAIGKKNVGLMTELKENFIGKSEANKVVNKEQAEEIFSWIEKSQRYSFNKSHSVSYAYNSYLTAYTKTHFPHEFFTSYLKNAIGKPDTYEEIQELVNNARIMDIEVQPPNVKKLNKSFKLLNNFPTFGLTDVKGVGESVYDKMIECAKENNINVNECDWSEFLIGFGNCIKVNAFEGLILCGALDCFELKRSVMSHELQHFKELSKREVPWIQECKKRNKDFSLGQCINTMILENDWKDTKRPIYRKDRLHDLNSLIESLKNPGYHFDDSPSWLAQQEEKYLGIALTCTKIDEYDISNANCTCKEFVNGFNSTHGISIAAQIEGVREWKIKNGKAKGQKMAFITISDSSCSLDNTVIFSEEWLKFKQHFKEGAVLLLRGSRDKKRNSFLIKSVHKIKNIT